MKRKSKIRAMNSKNLTDPRRMPEPLACSLCSFLSRAWATREDSQGRVVWALQNPTPPKPAASGRPFPGREGKSWVSGGSFGGPFKSRNPLLVSSHVSIIQMMDDTRLVRIGSTELMSKSIGLRRRRSQALSVS